MILSMVMQASLIGLADVGLHLPSTVVFDNELDRGTYEAGYTEVVD